MTSISSAKRSRGKNNNDNNVVNINNNTNERSNREGLRGWLNTIKYGWEEFRIGFKD